VDEPILNLGDVGAVLRVLVAAVARSACGRALPFANSSSLECRFTNSRTHCRLRMHRKIADLRAVPVDHQRPDPTPVGVIVGAQIN